MEETVIKETLIKRMSKNRFVKRLVLFVLLGWIFFSASYISFNEFNKTKLRFYESGYMMGYTSAVRQLINEAKDCSLIPVVYENNKVQLINYECVKKQTTISIKQSDNKKR